MLITYIRRALCSIREPVASTGYPTVIDVLQSQVHQQTHGLAPQHRHRTNVHRKQTVQVTFFFVFFSDFFMFTVHCCYAKTSLEPGGSFEVAAVSFPEKYVMA